MGIPRTFSYPWRNTTAFTKTGALCSTFAGMVELLPVENGESGCSMQQGGECKGTEDYTQNSCSFRIYRKKVHRWDSHGFIQTPRIYTNTKLNWILPHIQFCCISACLVLRNLTKIHSSVFVTHSLLFLQQQKWTYDCWTEANNPSFITAWMATWLNCGQWHRSWNGTQQHVHCKRGRHTPDPFAFPSFDWPGGILLSAGSATGHDRRATHLGE